MKLSTKTIAEFKQSSFIPTLTVTAHRQTQMIAPGASSCTLGSSCSCSCGAVSDNK